MDRRIIKRLDRKIRRWLSPARPVIGVVYPGTPDRAAEGKRLREDLGPEAIIFDVRLLVKYPDGTEIQK